MKLNHLRDVIAVAERGSLRGAARHLGMAQPQLTRSIRELEHELGAALFERRAEGMALTDIGRAFLRRATGIQLELQRTRDEVDQLRGVASGSVAVALSTAMHIALLPHVLKPFRRRYADVRLRIIESLFPAVEGDIRTGRIDFYVGPVEETARSNEFVIERLFANRRMIVGREGHPLQQAASLADLHDARWVTTSITSDSELELNPVFARHALPPPRIEIEAETALSKIVVVAYSNLLAMLPQQWLPILEATSVVRRIAVREDLAAPSTCSVTRARLPLTPAAEYLSDLLNRAAGQHARLLQR